MFVKRSAIRPRKVPRKQPKKASDLMQEYADISTIHGIQHIFRRGESWIHRTIWTVAFTVCTLGAASIVANRWTTFMRTPISTLVKDTHSPLGRAFFPAVALCPNNKIRRSAAARYISEHVDNSSIVQDWRLDQFLSAMTLMEHPHYENMQPYLIQASPLLDQLSGINLTDLMVQSMPRCEEIIESCLWHGTDMKCCGEDSEGLFGIQRSEEGFCYAFNSLTAEKNKKCMTGIGCKLLKSSSSGRGTGLEIFLSKFNESDIIHDAFKITNIRGIKVQVNNVAEFPEAGMGILVPMGHRSKMVSTVKLTLTESSPQIQSLPMEKRGCYFKGEYTLRITTEYTFKNCLIQCRMDFIKSICGCLPYYFNEGSSVPICNALQLWCLIINSKKLRIYLPASGETHGFDESEVAHSLNCTQCYPMCSEERHDADMDVTKEIFNSDQPAFMEFYYKCSGVVTYLKKVTFDGIDLLVSCGSICGLFLGGSLLSLVELGYWSIKAALIWVVSSWRKLKHPNHNSKFIKKQKYVHFWYP